MAREVNGFDTAEERMSFRAAFEAQADTNAEMLRACGWFWDIENFLRH